MLYATRTGRSVRKWKFGARKYKAKRLAAEVRYLLPKLRRGEHRSQFVSIRANVLTWQLIAEALEQVSKL